jgi:3-hydroxyisobutyrate dehydrogenase-like beta-hydroxyacid dehydrogenase
MTSDAIRTVGLLSPGDMGHSVGGVLRHAGARVITCLDGRTSRSAMLAEKVGIETVDSYEKLVREADIFLSIVPPARAGEVAERVANAIRTTGKDLVYVDCNAISPGTVRKVSEIVEGASGRFVDGGIIGAPPKPGSTGTRIYASGAHAGEFGQLRDYGLDIRVIGDQIGQASGVKMCYAALTKGLTALSTELMVAAEALGLSEPLRAEMEISQSTLLGIMKKGVPGMPPKAYRWVGEMEEIARTFEEVGLTPLIHQGAAEMYRFVESTPLGQETPENRTRGQTLDDVVTILAEALKQPAGSD